MARNRNSNTEDRWEDDRWEDDRWDDDPRDRRRPASSGSGRRPEPVRAKRSGFGTFLLTLLLVVAVGVFAYSGYKLIGYYLAYKAGSDEYSELKDDFLDV